MVNVSILTLKNAVVASLADARHVFTVANDLLVQNGAAPLFQVQLVGLWNEVPLNDGLFTIRPHLNIADVSSTDLIIIPALSGDMITSTYLNKDYANWLVRQYKNGAEVASLCVGAFLLAFSGLLKNKECTTHWDYINEFRSYYPAVHLKEEKIFTAQSGLYSSGGNNAYWNLLLYLIEKYADRQLAIQVAKYFVIDIDRVNQSPFAVFKGSRKHDDQLIKDIQEYIELNFMEKLNVSQIAEKYRLTRRTFERRFTKATYLTVAEYVQRVKIETAKKLLESGRKSIADVMLDVGYADTQAFREAFKRITDMTPVEYRNKYNL